MAQPNDTFLACVRPKFQSHTANLDKLLTASNRYYKSRSAYASYIISNALFRGEFQRNWNTDHTAQMLINTGIVRHFIENGGFGDLPKINKYKKYGAINAGCVRICIASIVAVAHSPFYTGEYYSKLSPLWQKIAQKVKPTYKVVLRSAVDDLIGSPGILWRPIILPNCYKYLVNSETDVFEDTSIMPWHNFPNVQIHRQPLPITRQLPSIAKSFRDIAVQTHELAAVVATTTSEAQTDAESDNRKNRVRIRDRKTFKLEIRNREVMKVFNKLMERELHRFAAANGDNDENPEQMSDELLATNQWFPVVSIKRSRSIENLMSADGADENGPTKKRKMRNTIN